MTCPSCGVDVTRDDRECPLCGTTLTPDTPPTESTGSVTTGSSQAAGHARASAPRPRRVAPLLAVGLVLVGIGIVLGAVLLGYGRPSTNPATPLAAGSSNSAASAPSETTPIPDTVDSSPSETEPPSEETSTDDTETSPSVTETGADVSGATGPTPAQYAWGTWILVLDSLEVDRYSYDEAVARARAFSGVTVVDSSTVPGLRPGYWALVSRDSYSSKGSASERCADFGRVASGACYPRRIGG